MSMAGQEAFQDSDLSSAAALLCFDLAAAAAADLTCRAPGRWESSCCLPVPAITAQEVLIKTFHATQTSSGAGFGEPNATDWLRRWISESPPD
jgi:hypothetical protein